MAGAPAAQLSATSASDIFSEQRFEPFQTYILKDGRLWAVQCSAGREKAAEMEQCKGALDSFQFQR